MKKILSAMLISLIGVKFVFGQPLDKSYVDNWIQSAFPEFNSECDVLYILNGVPFTQNSVNNELGGFMRSDLIQINLIDENMLDSLIFCRRYSNIVLLTTVGMQTKKSIRENFNKAKIQYSKFNIGITGDINAEKGEPVLIINGKQVFYKDCYFQINKIRLSEIIGINYIGRPVSPAFYGANGVNGLIEIKTK